MDGFVRIVRIRAPGKNLGESYRIEVGTDYTPGMRAIKLQTHVERDHTLHLYLPTDVKEGPAEVIVLVSETAEQPRHSLSDFLAHLSERPRTTRTKEEIDQYLQEERASWES
jgi:hypothetical protein